jgi:hypothetical protein
MPLSILEQALILATSGCCYATEQKKAEFHWTIFMTCMKSMKVGFSLPKVEVMGYGLSVSCPTIWTALYMLT